MSEIWQQYSKDKKYIVASHPFSPYLEVSGLDQGDIIYVNPLIRMREIILPLCQKESGLSQSEQEEIENRLFHFLAHLDRLQGISQPGLRRRQLDWDLLHGRYGEEIQDVYQALPERKRCIILLALDAWQMKNQPGLNLYRWAVQQFFPGALVYYYVPEDKFLTYIPDPKTEQKAKLLACLQALLLEWTVGKRDFWQYHFGLIGKNRTMRINQLVIY